MKDPKTIQKTTPHAQTTTTTAPKTTVGNTEKTSTSSAMPRTPTRPEQEFLATMRTLICVAKADGKIEEREKDALKSALMGVDLPAWMTLDGMLQETIDLDAQLTQVRSPGARERLLQSALAVAHSHGGLENPIDPATQSVVDRIRDAFGIGEEREKLFDRLWSETKDTVLPSNIQPISDPAQRAAAVEKDTLKYSVMSAVLGTFPVPGLAIATDLGVVALQVKMVRDIGQYWGHTVDRKAATSLLGSLGVGTGMRIAVSNLAKLVPGWGSVVGGTASFASTWALGKVAPKYFESGMKAENLKAEFRSAEKEGREAFSRQSEAIESKRKETQERIGALQADLESGKLTRADYEAKLANLA